MPTFKARTFKITIDDPEEAQLFINGLVLAKQNNSSPYFPQLLEAMNVVMEPYWQALMKEKEQGIGQDAKVSVV